MRNPRDENRTVRCFTTKCRQCGKPVLYWESIKGSKVFFDYPVIEKFHPHFCRIQKKITPSLTITERQFVLHHQEKFQCPLCGKVFEQESNLDQHLRERKKIDPLYEKFFQEIIAFDFLGGKSDDSDYHLKMGGISKDAPKFGKVSLRKDKKTKSPGKIRK